jgi:predicted phosphoribosyltransferase
LSPAPEADRRNSRLWAAALCLHAGVREVVTRGVALALRDLAQRGTIKQFRDRAEAGRWLAASLASYGHRADVTVLALPRGGVPVAFETARALGAPLDVFVVRKLGVPGQEELAMGAIATGGVRVINQRIVQQLAIPPSVIEGVAAVEHQELERRERLYRGDRPALPVRGRTVILVDDGVATGSTMMAAIEALRLQGPARIVIAAGVGSPQACAALSGVADACVCALRPPMLDGVGRWYADFSQTTDAEVRELLNRAAHEQSTPAR